MVKLSCYLRFFITFAATARSVRSARARPNFFIFLFSAFVLSPFLSLVFSLLHFLATSLAAYARSGEETRSDYGFPLKWRRDSADLFPEDRTRAHGARGVRAVSTQFGGATSTAQRSYRAAIFEGDGYSRGGPARSPGPKEFRQQLIATINIRGSRARAGLVHLVREAGRS